MTTYPAGSHRVTVWFKWATGETGDYGIDLAHAVDVTREQLVDEALRVITTERGHEFPPGPYTWQAGIR
ncbi:hypothetical protein ACFRCG_41760 [Embleya sp. NPDC056575]|uniref:hypothetical protein n=1 Tax=unclassified Embleya TaxID=2699296 RepID=UPI0036A641F0